MPDDNSDAAGLLGLRGKVALVSGGGGAGLGRAHCVQLARAGCDVMVADIDPDGGKASAEAVLALGRRAAFVRSHALDATDVTRMVQEAVERFGTVDVAVNNVGARGMRQSAILDYREDEFDDTFDACMKSVFLCTKAEGLAMATCGSRGSIINIASASAFVAADGFSLYGAGKAAVVQFTKTSAVELARFGIRVNAIAPGVMRADGPVPAEQEAVRRVHADANVMRRVGTYEEVAGLTVFFASQLSSYVTGQTLLADGGQTLRVFRPQRDPEPETTQALGVMPLFDVAVTAAFEGTNVSR